VVCRFKDGGMIGTQFNRQKVAPRLAGFLILLGACSLGFAGKPLSQTASSVDLAIALTGFCLACFGVLLILHGAALRQAWRESLEASAASAASTPEQLCALSVLDAEMQWRAPLVPSLFLLEEQRRRNRAARAGADMEKSPDVEGRHEQATGLDDRNLQG